MDCQKRVRFPVYKRSISALLNKQTKKEYLVEAFIIHP